jgi:ATP-binding cassette subfamily B (MDR/TAP) protein 1
MVGPSTDAIEPGTAIHGVSVAREGLPEAEKDDSKNSSSTVATPRPVTAEQVTLDEQVQFDIVKLSFFGIYGFATWIDLVLVAISTICAVIGGALIPVTPV